MYTLVLAIIFFRYKIFTKIFHRFLFDLYYLFTNYLFIKFYLQFYLRITLATYIMLNLPALYLCNKDFIERNMDLSYKF